MNITVLSFESLTDHLLWVLFETGPHVTWTAINLLCNGGQTELWASCLYFPYSEVFVLPHRTIFLSLLTFYHKKCHFIYSYSYSYSWVCTCLPLSLAIKCSVVTPQVNLHPLICQFSQFFLICNSQGVQALFTHLIGMTINWAGSRTKWEIPLGLSSRAFTDEGEPLWHGQHHFLGWRSRLNKSEKASWAPASIPLCLLTVGTAWSSLASCGHHAFPTLTDCVLQSGLSLP